MAWTTLSFGKYAGKTLPQVLFANPDWFFWALKQGAFRGKGPLEGESNLIGARARAIRIPQGPGEDLEAEYAIHPSVGKFAGVEVVPRSQPLHRGSTTCFRRNVFDLSVPREIAEYDKFGGYRLVKDLKFYLFGDHGYRMTKKRCEEFFDNPANFAV